jgi:hypothetical protein
MKRCSWRRSEFGVTFAELMIAMATSGMLLAAIVSAFISQQKAYIVQTQIADMTVNARTALDLLIRDIRLAGYGIPEASWLDQIDWLEDTNGKPVRISDPVTIQAHDQEPDELILIGAFDQPVGYIHGGVFIGDIDLQLRYESGVPRLNERDRSMIYIGRNEPAVVTSIPTVLGQQHVVRIDTHPTQPGNQGVAWAYANQSIRHPVELISVVTYQIALDSQSDDAPIPVLKRDTHTGGGAQPVAEYIEDLRFTRNGDTLTVTLTARTANADQRYRHPQAKDGYRRLTLSSQVKLRGLRF